MARFALALALTLTFALPLPAPASAPDPLPSWNDGAAKRAVTDFVRRVTTPGSPDYVRVDERVAVFDNDGTILCEQPVYFQYIFCADLVRERFARHPEWRGHPVYEAARRGDLAAIRAAGEEAYLALLKAAYAGQTADSFRAAVERWVRTARHPRTGRRYVEMCYRPMLELVRHLEARHFKVHILSGGVVEFMRVWMDEVYGIPPERVHGTGMRATYGRVRGRPTLSLTPEIDYYAVHDVKPVVIERFIGRRPLVAVGNSDGDLEMIEWTTAGDGPRLGLLLRHTDAEREWAYDRGSPIGRLERALDMAPRAGWTVVDMRRDWRTVFGE